MPGAATSNGPTRFAPTKPETLSTYIPSDRRFIEAWAPTVDGARLKGAGPARGDTPA